jgi:hypothetical protein
LRHFSWLTCSLVGVVSFGIEWVEQSSSRNTELLEVIGELEERHGKQSTRNMADLLNGAGYTTARGNQFTSGQVSRIMTKLVA